MEEHKTNVGQSFGIVGLVLGIISLLIAFIPCIGIFALLPGLIAIIFSAIALNQANKANGAKSLILAALVISIMSTLLAALWIFAVQQGGQWLKNHANQNIEQAFDNIMEDSGHVNQDMEKTMEELESSDTTSFNFHLDKHMSDQQFDQFLKEYEHMLKKIAIQAKNLKSNDPNAVIAYSKEAMKLARIMSMVALSSQELRPDQNQRIDFINKKYKGQLDQMNSQHR